ncbi:MAG: rod shape-determining protein MreD [Desulfuromonadaceae bacterium]|nr:rod shape-determining protein MreD [Desulfuromonadaceae bacterium]MDD5105891.1 rod shape-determining protein MreD [Desulfuromonadaceae bacterium]
MSRRTVILLLCIILAATVIQVALLPVFVRAPFKPDLLLIIMVYISLRGSYEARAPIAWLLGILKDVCSGLFVGLNASTFLISFVIIKSVSDRLYADSAILFVLAVTGVTLATFTMNLLMVVMFTNSPDIAFSMIYDLFPHILVNAFVASLIASFPGFEDQVEAT